MKQLIEKYIKLPKGVKASLWFTISSVMVKGVSFITLPIFSRLLTTSEYGIVSVYSSWVSVITILSTLTIWGGVFNVGMVKYADKSDELVSAFQGLATTITLIFMGITMLLIPTFENLFGMSKLMIICMYVEILSAIPFNLWSTVQRYNYEYRKLMLITILVSVLSPLLGVVAVLNTPYKAEAKILANVAVQLIVGIIFFTHNQIKGKKYFDHALWKFGFDFNVVLIPHYLSMQVLSQSDRIMISNMCGSSDAGIYSVAYNFGALLTLLTNGINTSFTPYIYKKMKEGDTYSIKKTTTSIVLLVAIATLTMIAFIPDVFHLVLPESYYASLHAIPPVTASCFFLFLYPLFGSIEFFYEENRYTTIASVVGAIANVILNYIFIKLFGYIAAAYTTLFCYICFSICHYFCMKKVMKKRGLDLEIYDIKKIVIISLAVIVGSIGINIVYDYAIVRWTIILIVLFMMFKNKDYLISILKTIKGA